MFAIKLFFGWFPCLDQSIERYTLLKHCWDMWRYRHRWMQHHLPCEARQIDHPLDVSGLKKGHGHLDMYTTKRTTTFRGYLLFAPTNSWPARISRCKGVLSNEKCIAKLCEVQVFCGTFGATIRQLWLWPIPQGHGKMFQAVATVAFSKWDYGWSMCHSTSWLVRLDTSWARKYQPEASVGIEIWTLGTSWWIGKPPQETPHFGMILGRFPIWETWRRARSKRSPGSDFSGCQMQTQKVGWSLDWP